MSTSSRGVLCLRRGESGHAGPRSCTDPVTGIPVLSAGPDAPVLTSREVQEILTSFP
jgi:hypothetical protein